MEKKKNQHSCPDAGAEGEEGPGWTTGGRELSKADKVVHAKVPGFPGHSAVTTLHIHCRGHEFHPCSGN